MNPTMRKVRLAPVHRTRIRNQMALIRVNLVRLRFAARLVQRDPGFASAAALDAAERDRRALAIVVPVVGLVAVVAHFADDDVERGEACADEAHAAFGVSIGILLAGAPK